MKKSVFKLALLATVAAPMFAGAAMAQDDLGSWDAKERFQIRGRIIGVLADGDGFVQEAPAAKTDVDNAFVPEVDLTYYFTKNVSAELIAATSKHTVDAGVAGVLGDAWILPPTLTLQYHFQPDAKFSPYVGAGLNYSLFYGEDDASGYNNLEVDGGVGYALQAGADYWLNDNWGLNVDVKYVDLDVDVKVNNGSADLHANDVDLNPWIVGAGVSYRF